jgi:DsbC/DsbD-like thiol-disulfide interchange protein
MRGFVTSWGVRASLLAVLAMLGMLPALRASSTPGSRQASGSGLQLPGNDPRHHAVVTATPPQITATAGAKLSLLLDIAPKPGIHVYAPGAVDYTPIRLELEPGPEITPGKLVYPKSEMLFFEPLNEHVPIFQKPFRLSREITLSRSVKSGSSVVVAGTVTYQACDDKVCYVPESTPVAWTILVK